MLLYNYIFFLSLSVCVLNHINLSHILNTLNYLLYEEFQTHQPYPHVVSWEPEGRYWYSKMFRWEPEGRYHCTKSMAIAPFWFSMERLCFSDSALLALNWLMYAFDMTSFTFPSSPRPHLFLAPPLSQIIPTCTCTSHSTCSSPPPPFKLFILKRTPHIYNGIIHHLPLSPPAQKADSHLPQINAHKHLFWHFKLIPFVTGSLWPWLSVQ